MKKTLIAATIAIISATTLAAPAQAGKFKFGFKKHWSGYHHVGFHKVWKKKRCFKYKHLYLKTGKKFWLKKYKRCRY